MVAKPFAKHTRRELLAHVAQIQNEIGLALEYSLDDRNPDRAGCLGKALARAHALCIQACSTDRPISPTEKKFLGFRIEPTVSQPSKRSP